MERKIKIYKSSKTKVKKTAEKKSNKKINQFNNSVHSSHDNDHVDHARLAYEQYLNTKDEVITYTEVRALLDGMYFKDQAETEADRVADEVVSGDKNKTEIQTRASTGGIQVSEPGIKNISDGESLKDKDRSFFESRMNEDFSSVRIHNDSKAHELSEELDAKAFTKGKDIYFNRGEYDTSSTEGKRLMAHELAHVVQGGNKDSTKIHRSKKGSDYTGKDKIRDGAVQSNYKIKQQNIQNEKFNANKGAVNDYINSRSGISSINSQLGPATFTPDAVAGFLAAIVDHLTIMNEIDRLAVLSNALHQGVARAVIDSIRSEIYYNKAPYNRKNIMEKAMNSRFNDCMLKDPVDGTAIIVTNSYGFTVRKLIDSGSKIFDLKSLEIYMNNILKAFEKGQPGIDTFYKDSNSGSKKYLFEKSYKELKKLRAFYDAMK